MIYTFPKFTKLKLSHKSEVENFTRNFEPYSDYNFISMWSWNIKNNVSISLLNYNLIIIFNDYVTSAPFLTFLGRNSVLETVHQLLKYSQIHLGMNELKLIPEETAKLVRLSSIYNVIEDPNNHDYISAIAHLCQMSGNKWRGKRNFVNRFKRLYQEKTSLKQISLVNRVHQKKLTKLLDTWNSLSEKKDNDFENENLAINRLLVNSETLKPYTLGLFFKNDLIGFVIFEIIHTNHAIIHYEKADTNYVGIYPYLKRELALHLNSKGVIHLNHEQDLGLYGLRKSKESYHPSHFLKKYIISLKSNLI